MYHAGLTELQNAGFLFRVAELAAKLHSYTPSIATKVSTQKFFRCNKVDFFLWSINVISVSLNKSFQVWEMSPFPHQGKDVSCC